MAAISRAQLLKELLPGLNALFDAGVLKKDAKAVATLLKSQRYVARTGSVNTTSYFVCVAGARCLSFGCCMSRLDTPTVRVSLCLSKARIGELLSFGGTSGEEVKRMFASVGPERGVGSTLTAAGSAAIVA